MSPTPAKSHFSLFMVRIRHSVDNSNCLNHMENNRTITGIAFHGSSSSVCLIRLVYLVTVNPVLASKSELRSPSGAFFKFICYRFSLHLLQCTSRQYYQPSQFTSFPPPPPPANGSQLHSGQLGIISSKPLQTLTSTTFG